IMFGAINSSYAFVYYITREYAFATQMLLLFGAVTAVAGMVEVVRRLWAKEWLNFRDTQLNPALVIMVAAAFGLLVIMMPPVQNYLAPNETMSVKWDSPQGIEVMGLIGLQNQVDELPEKVRKELLSFMKSVTTKKTPGPDDTVFQFAMQHLRQVTFTNSDGKPGIFWIHQSTDNDAFQALTRSTQSISGVGYEWISAFDIQVPESWSGQLLKFKLLPNKILPSERVDELLTQKFNQWNWKLTPLGEGEYRAEHTGGGCSATRQQLAQYFSKQCEEMDNAAKVE
ncbi:MAG TPA: hypothetical protein PKW15_05885, partial [Alphaproteobacteria bacterium]|nr:hypothetical protein [Alphaproteobacteria bacterium]